MRTYIWLLMILMTANAATAEDVTVWFGTATGPDDGNRGIYRATLNTTSGTLSSPERAAKIASPGFLAMHPDGSVLYSLCRLPETRKGGVASFRIADDERALNELNARPIGDGRGAHITVDRSGSCLFTAQYGAGSVAAFSLEEDGRIGPRTDLVKHEGSGPNTSRQKAPHPHWVGTGTGNQFLFVPDLGTDRVEIYSMGNGCELTPHGGGKCNPGSGPRHMKFHPDRPFAYVLNEMGLSVTAFHHNEQKGTLESFQTITTLPGSEREGKSTGSEIRIHPNGSFLYTANRGDDSISVFKIDPETGKLTPVEREPIRGKRPRNFNVDPTGNWLLAAGRTSDSVSVFQIDAETGRLSFTGNSVECPAPICVLFQPDR